MPRQERAQIRRKLRRDMSVPSLRWIRLVCREVKLSLSSICTWTPRRCAAISASAMSLRSLEYAATLIVEPRCAWFTAATKVLTSRAWAAVLPHGSLKCAPGSGCHAAALAAVGTGGEQDERQGGAESSEHEEDLPCLVRA